MNFPKGRNCLLIVLMNLLMLNAFGQSATDQFKIEASQGVASPLFFDPSLYPATNIQPGNFYDEMECTVRGGLGNFFLKLRAGRPVTVGFIGGSITQGEDCYRNQTAQFIQRRYPNARIKWINAGVSGTGTDLGACRIESQLLHYSPDLVFVEFAVNGAYKPGMEGIIRQVIKSNPATGICLIYAMNSEQLKCYQQNMIPQSTQGLESLAAYYNIPSIHLGMEAAKLEKQGALAWKSDSVTIEGKIVFSHDGLHPIRSGGNLYAAAIARAFVKMENSSTAYEHTLMHPLFTGEWENAKMLSPLDVAQFNGGWTTIDTQKDSSLNRFFGWFPYIMKAENAGTTCSFRFEGDMFGFFDIGGPEVGQVNITVDNKPLYHTSSTEGRSILDGRPLSGDSLLNRFNVFCNNRYRGQYILFETNPGKHTVVISVSKEIADKKSILGPAQLADINEHPAKYAQTKFYLGKILIRGVVIK